VYNFEAYRPLLFGIAYRMVGSVVDAEDLVQETYLRSLASADEQVRSPSAYLCTIITRLCINHLRSARVQRETYIGPWLPEPLLTDDYAAGPEARLEETESISMAFLVLLERLSPLSRAVFLLREVFDYDYAEIAEIVAKDTAACRQIFSRARKQLSANRRRRFEASLEEHQRVLAAFIQAVMDGNLQGLTRMLSDDVVLWADGGGKARGAATRPVSGAMNVASFVLSSRRFLDAEHADFELANVNGLPGLVVREHGLPRGVLTFEMASGGVSRLRVVANPDKLTRLQTTSRHRI
jgi:RNA polymerase sigma-70 factor, ECF subfamily